MNEPFLHMTEVEGWAVPRTLPNRRMTDSDEGYDKAWKRFAEPFSLLTGMIMKRSGDNPAFLSPATGDIIVVGTWALYVIYTSMAQNQGLPQTVRDLASAAAAEFTGGQSDKPE